MTFIIKGNVLYRVLATFYDNYGKFIEDFVLSGTSRAITP